MLFKGEQACTVAALRFPAPCRGRQSRRCLESNSLFPPQAALRRFPLRPPPPPVTSVTGERRPRRLSQCIFPTYTPPGKTDQICFRPAGRKGAGIVPSPLAVSSSQGLLLPFGTQRRQKVSLLRMKKLGLLCGNYSTVPSTIVFATVIIV